MAVSFSGSFPALNIAVLSAARVLDLHPVIISSVGSSMYGANQPEMTWLDMERILADKGLFPYRSNAASLGGIAGTREAGRNVSTAVLRDAGGRVVGGAETFRDLARSRRCVASWRGKPAAFINVRIGDLVA